MRTRLFVFVVSLCLLFGGVSWGAEGDPVLQGDGILYSSNFASEIAALAASGADTTLIVRTAQNVSGNVTVPENVSLRFERGGKLTMTTSSTKITINGSIDAGFWQVFDADHGNSEYVIIGTQVPKRPVEWWGATGDDSTNDYDAFKEALASCSVQDGGGIITFDASKVYVLNNGSSPAIEVDRDTLPDGTNSSGWSDAQFPVFGIEGRGKANLLRDATPAGYLKITGTGDGIVVKGPVPYTTYGRTLAGKLVMRNFTIHGNNTADDGITLSLVNQFNIFEDLAVRNFTGDGIQVDIVDRMNWGCIFTRVNATRNEGWGYVVDGNAHEFRTCYAEGNGGGGIKIGADIGGYAYPQANVILWRGGTLEYNRIPQILVDTTDMIGGQVIFNDVYFEGQMDTTMTPDTSGTGAYVELTGNGVISFEVSGSCGTVATGNKREKYFVKVDTNIRYLTIGPLFVGLSPGEPGGPTYTYVVGDTGDHTINVASYNDVYSNTTADFENSTLQGKFSFISSNNLSAVNIGVGSSATGDEELRIRDTGAPKLVYDRADANAQVWSVYVNSGQDLTWQDDDASDILMRLTDSTGNLYIDGTYYDTGASLEPQVLEGDKKWVLLDSLLDGYRKHDLSLLAESLKHKTGEGEYAKSLSDLIQLQAECIADLRARVRKLEAAESN